MKLICRLFQGAVTQGCLESVAGIAHFMVVALAGFKERVKVTRDRTV